MRCTSRRSMIRSQRARVAGQGGGAVGDDQDTDVVTCRGERGGDGGVGVEVGGGLVQDEHAGSTSRMSTRGSTGSVRATATRARWPPARPAPASPTTVSSPAESPARGRPRTNSDDETDHSGSTGPRERREQRAARA
ncbi:hypothetical protein A6A25_32545 [Saccharothrix sp. CB00851]|nr:hypothetical protein A6A25_32545 [Saccharothrix sp. CB00851]